MLKIQNQFWNDIIEKRKTIEFRKVNKLNDLLMIEGTNIFSNGRIGVLVFDSETKKKIGKLIFNGSKIINKEYLFKLIDDYYNHKIWTAMDTILNILGLEYNIQFNWISNNLDWIKEYYKNESEILILYIESFESVKNE